jgi:hypothetical protein
MIQKGKSKVIEHKYDSPNPEKMAGPQHDQWMAYFN